MELTARCEHLVGTAHWPYASRCKDRAVARREDPSDVAHMLCAAHAAEYDKQKVTLPDWLLEDLADLQALVGALDPAAETLPTRLRRIARRMEAVADSLSHHQVETLRQAAASLTVR